MTGNINAEPDYGDEPPPACLSRVFLGHDSFACGATPGHTGKHGYRLPWVTIEWDGRAERAAGAAPAPASLSQVRRLTGQQGGPPNDAWGPVAQSAPELAAPIVLNMDAPGPAAPYEPALIPERVVTGYGPTADAIRAEVDADNAKDRLIAKLHRDVDSLRANVERLRGLLNEARIAEPRELAAAMAALAGELEAEAFRLAPPGAPEDPPDMADYIRAEALSVAASRIRDRAGVPS